MINLNDHIAVNSYLNKICYLIEVCAFTRATNINKSDWIAHLRVIANEVSLQCCLAKIKSTLKILSYFSS